MSLLGFDLLCQVLFEGPAPPGAETYGPSRAKIQGFGVWGLGFRAYAGLEFLVWGMGVCQNGGKDTYSEEERDHKGILAACLGAL